MSSHRERTPVLEPREPWGDFPTPNKAKIQGAVEFCERMNIPYYKEDVFRTFGVSRQRGYEILKNKTHRRLRNDSNATETRGRKKIITPKQIREMERILETTGLEGRALTWEQLGFEANVEASGRTIKRTMETMDYHKCIACQRGWVSQSARENRLRYAKEMLKKYPEPEDWYRVRFSDEVHFGWGAQGRLRIDQILEPIVKLWLDEGQDFVLEEDGDSGHGPSKSNIVRTWKENNGLEFSSIVLNLQTCRPSKTAGNLRNSTLRFQRTKLIYSNRINPFHIYVYPCLPSFKFFIFLAV
jgi:hypothetical protein